MKLTGKYSIARGVLSLVVGILSVQTILGQERRPIDAKATTETIALYQQLFELSKKGTMLGHQDDLAYGHGWYGVANRSDVKTVTGKYPAVIGWEIGNVELGKATNLDSIYFDDMKGYIQKTHKRGGLSTISWHGNNIATGKNAWDCKQDTVVRSILPNGKHHEEYLSWLDKVADFFLSLKDEKGRYIPVVFRPYHEHTGAWFWWGTRQCSPDEYKALWRMTVSYLQDKKQVHHVLYCYSPSETTSEAEYLERYPGDDVVDILAFDSYVQGTGTDEDLQKYSSIMQRNIAIVTAYAQKSGKLATIGETGFESIPYPQYYTKVIYPLIEGKELAWILFWRNAYTTNMRHHFYVPYRGHAAAKDFKIFSKIPGILLGMQLR